MRICVICIKGKVDFKVYLDLNLFWFFKKNLNDLYVKIKEPQIDKVLNLLICAKKK